MSERVELLQEFVRYHATLSGDEKGEAQVFCDRLFRAFGHKGYKEAGATLEARVKRSGKSGTGYADLIWKPKLLIEMKKRGEKLQTHYRQAFEYWLNAVPDRPRYVVLCNFDEFWIYDFDRQLDEPVDRVAIADLPTRYSALNFLDPKGRTAVFGNDREDVSRKTANKMAELFKVLTGPRSTRIQRDTAQRMILQLVVALFAEDIDLLPKDTVTSIVQDCLSNGQSSYDLFGGLFRQMNDPEPARGGRYADVPYFNGGLFARIEPVEMNPYELSLIGGEEGAAIGNWSKVNPAIFGTLFQQSMDAKEQHKHGRHFTSEADIQRIVGPTIVRPWQDRIDGAASLADLLVLREELGRFRVLDPSCGSGNFLYVAYRELVRLEIQLLHRIRDIGGTKEFADAVETLSVVTPSQFYGIDNDPFGVELAKVTLMLAKKLAHDEAVRDLGEGDAAFAERARAAARLGDDSLPLDNLDGNIVLGDAMFVAWPACEAIVGNPPYQSKNKLQQELGPEYLERLRKAHPEIDGRADFCVYWFRLAHDHLQPGQRAGLVGTNTVRQNYSRIGGLDYIAANGGTITEAVSSMNWPGPAAVHVSIVNWIRGEAAGEKRLYVQEGNTLDEGWRHTDLPVIPTSLSFATDVTTAGKLKVNAAAGCFQGQTHGHNSFLWTRLEATALLKAAPEYAQVLKPFLTADNLIGEIGGKPKRYVADFTAMDVLEARAFPKALKPIEAGALVERKKAAKKETTRNSELIDSKGNQHHANFLKHWWRMSYPREDMLNAIRPLPRYIVCGQVTKRPIFEFLSTAINPNAALIVFAYADDYSFGILQSSIHWVWFTNRCSTLTERFRYTSNTVFDSFPWPQSPSAAAVKKVADAAKALRDKRRELCVKHHWPLRELYRTLETPGAHPLRAAIDALDAAVRAAYGMTATEDVLGHLLVLNLRLAKDEATGTAITGPGLPPSAGKAATYISDDAVTP